MPFKGLLFLNLMFSCIKHWLKKREENDPTSTPNAGSVSALCPNPNIIMQAKCKVTRGCSQ